MTDVKRVWLIHQEDDSAESFTAVVAVNSFGTFEEAAAHVRQYQRIGKRSQRPLLSVNGPWRDTGSGYARIEGETRTTYPE